MANSIDDRIWKSLDTISEQVQTVANKVQDVHLRVQENTTHLKTIVGNGHPGKLNLLETKVDNLETFKNKLVGWVAGVIACSSLLSLLIEHVLKNIGTIMKFFGGG